MPAKKAHSTQETPESESTPKFERNPDYKTLYVNYVQSGFTAFDISLVIGHNHGFGVDGPPTIELLAKITMSPVEAKLVAEILKDAVKRYESVVNEIKVPSGLLIGPAG